MYEGGAPMYEGGAHAALERVRSEENNVNDGRRHFRPNTPFNNLDVERVEQELDEGLYTSNIDDPMIPDVKVSTSDVLKVKSS